MSKRICEHIQADGLRCTNPAMYRREVCFQHWRQLRPDVPPSDPAYVPSFDSEASISNASAHMFRSVLAGKVDLKQGRLALQFLRETAFLLQALCISSLPFHCLYSFRLCNIPFYCRRPEEQPAAGRQTSHRGGALSRGGAILS